MDNLVEKKVYFNSDEIKLIPPEEEDIVLLQRWINLEEISYFNGSRFPVSYVEQKEYYQRLIKDSSKKKLIIVDKQNQKVGLISLMKIDYKNANAEIAVYIDPDYQNKGFASKSLKLMVNFAFYEMRMNKIYANILDFNVASIKTFQKAGFRHEATLKENFYSSNKFHDIFIFSLFKIDYK